MNNGLISSLSLDSIRYLDGHFQPYQTFLEINILLSSTLSIGIKSLFLLNANLLIYLSLKIILFPLFLILYEKQ